MDCSTEPHNIIIDVHVNEETLESSQSELRAGLMATPRRLPTKYLYDDRGSEIFEAICELPEYYQTAHRTPTPHKLRRPNREFDQSRRTRRTGVWRCHKNTCITRCNGQDQPITILRTL